MRNKEALPCVRRCSWWVQAVRGETFFREIQWPVRWVPAVRGKHFFREIRWPVRWVPAVRWRNNYFPRNKEALPCGRRGPSCQPLHVQYSSDGSRSLTTLTTPCREHQGGGRRRGLGREQHGGREYLAVVSHAEGSTTVRGFTSSSAVPENNSKCG